MANQVETIITDDEGNQSYIPIASATNAGIASFDAKDFAITPAGHVKSLQKVGPPALQYSEILVLQELPTEPFVLQTGKFNRTPIYIDPTQYANAVQDTVALEARIDVIVYLLTCSVTKVDPVSGTTTLLMTDSAVIQGQKGEPGIDGIDGLDTLIYDNHLTFTEVPTFFILENGKSFNRFPRHGDLCLFLALVVNVSQLIYAKVIDGEGTENIEFAVVSLIDIRGSGWYSTNEILSQVIGEETSILKSTVIPLTECRVGDFLICRNLADKFGVYGSITQVGSLSYVVKTIAYLRGPEGPVGQEGQIGAAGPTGIQGQQGPVGPQGVTGQAGGTGATGPSGPTGADGPQGQQGVQGPSGPQGVQGDSGVSTINTPISVAFQIVDTNNFSCTSISFESAKTYNINAMLTGALGVTLYLAGSFVFGSSGIFVGTRSVANVPRACVLNMVYDIAGKKITFAVTSNDFDYTGISTTHYAYLMNGIKGDQGQQGPAGQQGLQGPKGADGAEGAAGPTGPTGPEGAQGLKGPTGYGWFTTTVFLNTDQTTSISQNDIAARLNDFVISSNSSGNGNYGIVTLVRDDTMDNDVVITYIGRLSGAPGIPGMTPAGTWQRPMQYFKGNVVTSGLRDHWSPSGGPMSSWLADSAAPPEGVEPDYGPDWRILAEGGQRGSKWFTLDNLPSTVGTIVYNRDIGEQFEIGDMVISSSNSVIGEIVAFNSDTNAQIEIKVAPSVSETVARLFGANKSYVFNTDSSSEFYEYNIVCVSKGSSSGFFGFYSGSQVILDNFTKATIALVRDSTNSVFLLTGFGSAEAGALKPIDFGLPTSNYISIKTSSSNTATFSVTRKKCKKDVS